MITEQHYSEGSGRGEPVPVPEDIKATEFKVEGQAELALKVAELEKILKTKVIANDAAKSQMDDKLLSDIIAEETEVREVLNGLNGLLNLANDGVKEGDVVVALDAIDKAKDLESRYKKITGKE